MLNTAYKWEESAHPKRDSVAVASEMLSTALRCFCNASDLFKLRASRDFNDFVIATAELQVVRSICCHLFDFNVDTCHPDLAQQSLAQREDVSLRQHLQRTRHALPRAR